MRRTGKQRTRRHTVGACSTLTRSNCPPWSLYPGVRFLPRETWMDRTPRPPRASAGDFFIGTIRSAT
ncbi:hypothetical protein HMPREF1550_01742 [Actinomyces sp. oral taxon 877 str. F0543]|nr:hypothetical protein HMPREF1550_01742 [Actinomyces sp. oral taxon 877 str. F0543]